MAIFEDIRRNVVTTYKAEVGQQVAGLDRIAQKTKAAGAATSEFGKVAAEALKKHNAAIERTHKLHDELTRKNQPLVKSFAALAEAIKREHDMLDNIRGPAQRYAQDLQTLQSLMRSGKISAAEYTDQLGRMRAELGKSQAKPGESFGGKLGGALGSFRGAAAVAGVAVGASQILELTGEFQNLQNRLRFLTGGDLPKTNALFAEMQRLARDTRAELSTTTEGFVKISLATKSLGLTQTETIKFTERLNKAIALSGASTTNAQAAMLQLSQGLSAGALRGEEFNSVLENAPVIIQTIAQQLGVTTGQLRQMAFDGKLTSQVVIDAFTRAGASIDKDFANTIPTVQQSMSQLKNEFIVSVGEIDKATGASKVFGEALVAIGDAARQTTSIIKEIDAELNNLGGNGSLKDILSGSIFKKAESLGIKEVLFEGLIQKTQKLFGVTEEATQAQDDFAKSHGAVVLALMQGEQATKAAYDAQAELSLRWTIGAAAAEKFRIAVDGANRAVAVDPKWIAAAKEMPDLGKAIESQLIKVNRQWAFGSERTTKHKEKLDLLGETLKSLNKPWQDAAERAVALNTLHETGALDAERYRTEMGKVRDILLEYGKIKVASQAGPIEVIDFTQGISTLEVYNDTAERAAQLTERLYASFEKRRQASFLEKSFGKIEEFNAYETAFGTLNSAVQSSMSAWIDGSVSLGDAIKKGIGTALASLASSMAVEALKHGAYAIGSLAFYDYTGAARHGAAAAAFGAGAAAAAAAARELGTSANASSASASSATGTSASSGASGGGGGGDSTGNGAGATGERGRDVIYVYGDPFANDSPRQRMLTAEKQVRKVLSSYGENS